MPTWMDGPYGEDRHYKTMMVLRGDKITYVNKKIVKKIRPVTIRKVMVVNDKVLMR